MNRQHTMLADMRTEQARAYCAQRNAEAYEEVRRKARAARKAKEARERRERRLAYGIGDLFAAVFMMAFIAAAMYGFHHAIEWLANAL